jgi:hypothetical protein
METQTLPTPLYVPGTPDVVLAICQRGLKDGDYEWRKCTPRPWSREIWGETTVTVQQRSVRHRGKTPPESPAPGSQMESWMAPVRGVLCWLVTEFCPESETFAWGWNGETISIAVTRNAEGA